MAEVHAPTTFCVFGEGDVYFERKNGCTPVGGEVWREWRVGARGGGERRYKAYRRSTAYCATLAQTEAGIETHERDRQMRDMRSRSSRRRWKGRQPAV